MQINIDNKIAIELISSVAALGAIGTVYFAQKAVNYRRAAIKNINAFNTVNHLMFEAKKRIDDPVKLAEFEEMVEHDVTITGDINKYAI